MKTTVLTAALLLAFAMPAFAEDAIKTDDAAKMTKVDPVTTSSTTTGKTDLLAPTVSDGYGYSGCIHRKTTAEMM